MQASYRTTPAYRSLKALSKKIEAQYRKGKEKNRGAWTVSIPKELLRAMIADSTTFEGFVLQDSRTGVIALHYKYPSEWNWPTLVIHLASGLTSPISFSVAIINEDGEVKGGPPDE